MADTEHPALRKLVKLLQHRPLTLPLYHAIGEHFRRLDEDPTVSSLQGWRTSVAKLVGAEATLNECLQFRLQYAESDLPELEQLNVGWRRLTLALTLEDKPKRYGQLARARKQGWNDRDRQLAIQRLRGSRRGESRRTQSTSVLCLLHLAKVLKSEVGGRQFGRRDNGSVRGYNCRSWVEAGTTIYNSNRQPGRRAGDTPTSTFGCGCPKGRSRSAEDCPDIILAPPVAIKNMPMQPQTGTPTMTVIRPGDQTNAVPFTIVIVANPALESPWGSGRFVVDPVISDQHAFDASVRYVDDCLFGNLPEQREKLLADPQIAPRVRVVSLFIGGLSADGDNSLAAEDGVSDLLVARRDAFAPFLTQYGLQADIAYAVSQSVGHRRASAWQTTTLR